jgi:hypothetical protein
MLVNGVSGLQAFTHCGIDSLTVEEMTIGQTPTTRYHRIQGAPLLVGSIEFPPRPKLLTRLHPVHVWVFDTLSRIHRLEFSDARQELYICSGGNSMLT